MVSRSNLEQQLKQINFNPNGWGRSEINELCNILMPTEEIDECVNGSYEAGFALLVATKDRLLLVDKKPMNYLTVEDLRFDMINEFDYSHRLLGAEVKISAGMKTLHFRSLNQARLRRLLGFVQYRMTELKKVLQSHQEAQKEHLEQMNQQLQMFLAVQQYQHQQQQLAQQHLASPQTSAMPAPVSSHPLLSNISSNISNFAHLATGTRDHDVSDTSTSSGGHISADQLGVAAMKRVVPVISAYTRLPLMSQHRRFPGSATT